MGAPTEEPTAAGAAADDPRAFRYSTLNRFAFVFVAVAVLVPFALLGWTEGLPDQVRTIGYWLGNGALVALFTWPSCWIMHRRRLRTTHPVELSATGVAFARHSSLETSIPWSNLTSIEPLSIRDAPRYGGLRGILLVGTGSEIPVLRSLRGFAAFSAELECHALATAIPFPPNDGPTEQSREGGRRAVYPPTSTT